MKYNWRHRTIRRIYSTPKLDPYLPMRGDPAFILHRDKSKQVLTSPLSSATLNVGNKPRKVDDKMVKKQKQMSAAGAVALLTIFGVIGVAHILGGELKHYIVAGMLCLLLFAYATDK